MKKILLFSVFWVIAIFFEGSLSLAFEWSKTFGGSDSDGGSSVHQTADGGFIIAGRTQSFGAGGSDVYLIKTDGSGNQQWSKTFGGSSNDSGSSVQQTADGGFIIAGRTQSFGAGGSDVYLIKTDGSGNQQWSKTFGGTSEDYGYSVQQTADGGFIIAGTVEIEFSDLDWDVYLIKTDGSGNQQWSKTFGGWALDYGYSVQQTADGGFIIAGHIDTWDYGEGPVYLIKTDGSGNQQWSKTFGGGITQAGYSVQQTADGGFIIAGITESFDFEVYVYLIKTDGTGNELWNKTFGDGYTQSGYSVQQTADGGFIIAGDKNLSGPGGSNDVYLIKTDGSGNQQWSKTFGGTEGDSGASVQQTSDGGFIITGGTTSFGAGSSDVYLVYYKPEFVDVLPGSNHEASIYAIYKAGITTGCSQNPLRFCPQDPVTRAQMAAFIIRALEGEPPSDYCDTGSPFPDVDPTLNVCKYIKRLSELGITTGYPDGTYRPYNNVTRAQMAAFIIRALEGEPPTDYCDTGSPFPDVSANSPTCKYIKRFFELGITTGYSDGTYRPRNNIIRRQMAAFLDRAFLDTD